ncbi:MAG TPA: hypothetical protein VGR97_05510 [Candidatus Acidoferrales bacterium]|nr:hypothetical protein [Candidatus Acidoferrales bacterium]
MEQETQKQGIRIESLKADLGKIVGANGADFVRQRKVIDAMEVRFRADKKSNNCSGGDAGDGVYHGCVTGRCPG